MTNRPWDDADPVGWAESTERITASSAGFWRAKHRDDPAGTEATLVQLSPVPGVRLLAATMDRLGLSESDDPYAELFGPDTATGRPILASAAGYRQPSVDASPPRDMTVYRNAVEELRATHPGLVRAAERGGPAPEMFPGFGDYPAVTASGIDPAVLRTLPWQARLAAAWAPTMPLAARIVNDYADGAYFADELIGEHAVRDYVARTENWFRTSGLGD